jgi:6-phosphogluconolactonase
MIAIHRPGLAFVAGLLFFTAMSQAAPHVYVSNADSREISVLSMDSANGALSAQTSVSVPGQAGPMALSPDKRFLYIALRSQPYALLSFAIDKASGALHQIGSAPLPDSMAHIATDRTGRTIFGASYGGHKLSVSPVDADGVAGEPKQVLPTGQNAHATLVDPSNRFVFVTNLGSDLVMQWRFDAARSELSPNDPPTFAARDKAGPRHLVFHPDGRHVLLLNELDAGVDVLAFDPERGTLSRTQTLSTLPKGFTGKPWAADIHLTPDGRFLYTSERTSSTLASFEFDAPAGKLKPLAHTPTEQQPRGFAIDPSGRWLIAAGQLSNALSVYAIDRSSGGLQKVGSMPVGQGPHWVEIVERP